MKFIISGKREDKSYGILAGDFEIRKKSNSQVVVASRRNLYRIKKNLQTDTKVDIQNAKSK